MPQYGRKLTEVLILLKIEGFYIYLKEVKKYIEIISKQISFKKKGR
jgi:hypothetical protein